MTLPTPDWLTRHGGELRPGVGGTSWVVFFDGEPQYRLEPVPVKGRHGCKVTQTINGRMVASEGLYPTIEDAVRGGLEELRQALGW
jgi:hypothetical protein